MRSRIGIIVATIVVVVGAIGCMMNIPLAHAETAPPNMVPAFNMITSYSFTSGEQAQILKPDGKWHYCHQCAHILTTAVLVGGDNTPNYQHTVKLTRHEKIVHSDVGYQAPAPDDTNATMWNWDGVTPLLQYDFIALNHTPHAAQITGMNVYVVDDRYPVPGATASPNHGGPDAAMSTVKCSAVRSCAEGRKLKR